MFGIHTNYTSDLDLMGDRLFVHKHALDKDIISLLSMRERVEVWTSPLTKHFRLINYLMGESLLVYKARPLRYHIFHLPGEKGVEIWNSH